MGRPVALVTGAAKRVGHAIAQRFATEGYDLVVHYGNSATEAGIAVEGFRQRGVRAVACRADLTDPEELVQMIATTYQHFGRLDALVNCAAVFFPDHLQDFRLQNLERCWQVNCRAPLILTQAFYNEAKKRGQQGVVINVVDQKVRDNFHPDDFSYTVSKTALGHLTAMLAISVNPVLRVNAVYPGLMAPSGDQTQEDFEYACRHSTPLGYIATPEHVAEAVMLLTRPSFNGADFVVDAGQNLVRVDHDVISLYRSPSQRKEPVDVKAIDADD